MSAGVLCGVLWEFWNYYALAKWTYHLPFLGSLEHYRLFEMPILGFLGFPAFAVECWVALNTMDGLCRSAGLRIAEALPDEEHIL